MKKEYQRVLDESLHNNLEDLEDIEDDYDEDTVEIVLNSDAKDKTSYLDGRTEDNNIAFKSLKDAFNSIYYAWNILTFAWVKPLLVLGNSRPLEQNDLYELSINDSSKGVYSKFRSVWKEQLKTPTKSLMYTYLTAFGYPFFAAGLLKLVHDSCLFLGPYLLKRIIIFLNNPSIPLRIGLLYVIGLFIANMIMSLCLRQYFFWCFRVGMRLRTSVITSVFHKSLKINISALAKRSTGEITNLMSLDSSRLQELTPYLHAIWYSFFQIAVALYFLWDLLGLSTLSGVAVIVICIPITGNIAAYLKRTQAALSRIRDERVKTANEVLSGIKVIKIQAWEEEFEKRLNDIRHREMTLFYNYGIMQSISATFSSAIPLLVALATFLTFILSGGVLDVAIALPALALFEILRFPLFMLPTVLNNLIEANVAITRIRSFLLEKEKEVVGQQALKSAGALATSATLVWDSGARRMDEDRRTQVRITAKQDPLLYFRLNNKCNEAMLLLGFPLVPFIRAL